MQKYFWIFNFILVTIYISDLPTNDSFSESVKLDEQFEHVEIDLWHKKSEIMWEDLVFCQFWGLGWKIWTNVYFP